MKTQYWQKEQETENTYFKTFKSHFFLTGDMIQPFLVSLIDLIDQNMTALKLSKGYRTKVKLVSIEIIENALKHGDKSLNNPTFFRIGFSTEKVLIECGNPVSETGFEKLKIMLAELKEQSVDEIRKRYEEQLKSDDFYSSGNGGLGLFTIAIRSDLQLEFDFKQDENERFYIISASLQNPVPVA